MSDIHFLGGWFEAATGTWRHDPPLPQLFNPSHPCAKAYEARRKKPLKRGEGAWCAYCHSFHGPGHEKTARKVQRNVKQEEEEDRILRDWD